MLKWIKYIIAPWKTWDYYYQKEFEIAVYMMNKKEKETQECQRKR